MSSRQGGNPTSGGRVLVFLAVTFVLAGCSITPYRYVELTSDNVSITEVGRPPIGGVIGGKRAIPIRYTLDERGVSVSLALTPGYLSIKVESSVPIAAVSIEPGHVVDMSPLGLVIRESPFEYTVNWRLMDYESSAAGMPVQLVINLEDRVDPIVVSGVVAESGKLIYGIGI